MQTRRVEFDYTSPDIAGPQFWDAVVGLQRLGPLVWVESNGGFWAATTFAMNLRIAQDWRTFTSSEGVARTRASFEAVPPLVPIELDPPRHRTFRKNVNPALTAKVVSPLEDEIRAIADELIDGFTAAGECDIAADFARKFPGTVFFRLVAHSTDEEFRKADLAARRMSFQAEDQELFAKSAAELRAWAGRVFAEHGSGGCPVTGAAWATGPDLADAIMHLPPDADGPWAATEHMAGLQIMAQGGISTSAHAIGAIVVALCENPELQERVRADLSLVPGLVEEMLRLEPPIPIMFRTAAVDVEIEGQRVRKGDKICLIFGAAGRDPAVFENPATLDLDRPHCRHITFGAGVHRCIGSNLARLQIQVAVEQLLTRLAPFEIPAGAEVTYSSRQSRGPSSIPLTFRRS